MSKNRKRMLISGTALPIVLALAAGAPIAVMSSAEVTPAYAGCSAEAASCEAAKPCNPCAAANPCCAVNPCAAEGEAKCAAEEAMVNPCCAVNPCGAADH